MIAFAACQSDPPTTSDGGSARGVDSGARADAARPADTARAPDTRFDDDARADTPAPPDAAGSPDRPAPTDGAAAPPPTGLSPPKYPPPGTGACAPECKGLQAQYADAVLRAQSCTPAAGSVCGHHALGSLGCYACEVWVNDLAEIAPIYERFNQMGCFGCFFDGAPGENRCHPYGCADLGTPMCLPAGTGGSCTNKARDLTCPADIKTGTPCTKKPDVCTGGPHGGCFCSADSPSWTCVR